MLMATLTDVVYWGAAQRMLLVSKQTIKTTYSSMPGTEEHVSGWETVWPDCKCTHAHGCKHTYMHGVLQQKGRWANLLPQQDQAGLVRQRLHKAETDAVEKYCRSTHLRQTHDVWVCVCVRLRKRVCWHIHVCIIWTFDSSQINWTNGGSMSKCWIRLKAKHLPSTQV